MESDRQADGTARSGARLRAEKLRFEARLYLCQFFVGLLLAAANLGGTRDGVAWLLGGAGLLTAAVAFVLWRKRRRDARLAEA